MKSAWPAKASVVTAIMASACRWLRLVLVAHGLSATGMSAVLAGVRPFLLALSTVLLELAFFLDVSHTRAYTSGSAQAKPDAGDRQRSRRGLSTAAGLVLFVAVFPHNSGLIMGSRR
jgi:hypothetical protein